MSSVTARYGKKKKKAEKSFYWMWPRGHPSVEEEEKEKKPNTFLSFLVQINRL